MIGWGRNLLHGSGWAPLALNPVEKFEAASEWSGRSSGAGWLGWLLVAIVLAVAAAATAVMLLRRRAAARLLRQLLERQARDMGLSEAERHVLTAIAGAVRRRDAAAVLTSALAFERGAAALLRSSRVTAMSPQRREAVTALTGSLRAKLGFDRPEAADEVLTHEPRPQIAQGDRLMVVHRGEVAAFDVHVADTSPDEMVVETAAPLDYRPDETWLVRYSRGGKLYEFDTRVLRREAGKVALSRGGRPRFINRRRFPRVPTRKPARVARFPFARGDMSLGADDFVAGELVEIGGTGVRIAAPIDVQRNERVLVTLELGPGNVVEGMGKVIRTDRDEEGPATVVVELLGLSGEEISKLAHETNVAAQENAAAPAGPIDGEETITDEADGQPVPAREEG